MTPTPTTPDELARALRQLARLAPVERARRARRLVDVAKAVLSQAADAAVTEAAAEHGAAVTARLLGVTPSAVSNATTRHRARLAPASIPEQRSPSAQEVVS